MSRPALPRTLAFTGDPGLGEPSITITTNAVDRHRDRVFPEGAKTDVYMQNPVVLFGHNYDALPVGTCTSLQSTESGIKATWKWLEGDAFADRVKNAWDQGVLRAASIGFIPKKHEFDEERKGYDIKEWELLEFSIVPIPANPEAVRTLKSLGLLDLPESDADAKVKTLEATCADLTTRLAAIESKAFTMTLEDQARPLRTLTAVDAVTLTPVKATTTGWNPTMPPDNQTALVVVAPEADRLVLADDDDIVLTLADEDDRIAIDDAVLADLVRSIVSQQILAPLASEIGQRTAAAVALAQGRVL